MNVARKDLTEFIEQDKARRRRAPTRVGLVEFVVISSLGVWVRTLSSRDYYSRFGLAS